MIEWFILGWLAAIGVCMAVTMLHTFLEAHRPGCEESPIEEELC